MLFRQDQSSSSCCFFLVARCGLLLVVVLAISTTTHALVPQQSRQAVSTAIRQFTPWDSFQSPTKRHCDCPNDNDEILDEDDDADVWESRREVLFATLGSLWAMTSTTVAPLPAHATYGSDAKIEMPDVIQGMSDRTTKQCLVESLGNRECLVYREDEDKLLYKGANVDVLLERIQQASTALEQDIPALVATKQWTKITGVLTGPMGQLSSTMVLLTKLADRPDDAKAKAQIVKQDVFGMGTAATNKQPEQVLQYQQAAIVHLAEFIKSL